MYVLCFHVAELVWKRLALKLAETVKAETMKWNGLQLQTSCNMSTMAHTEVEFHPYCKDKGKPFYKETQINIQSLCTWQDQELYVPAGSVQDTLQLSDILQIIQVFTIHYVSLDDVIVCR